MASSKFAEKLTILTEHGRAILIRLYNSKVRLEDPRTRPAYLSDKRFEKVVKFIENKFPEAYDCDKVGTPTTLRAAGSLLTDILFLNRCKATTW